MADREKGSAAEGSYHVGVLARAYAILDAVSDSPRTVLELSESMGADSRTVYRITRNLEINGFLRRVPTDQHRFALGFRLLQLGNRASEQLDLRVFGAETLKNLAALTGESALLSVRSGHEIVFAKRVDGSSSLRLSVEEGSRRPLPMGAAGKVLTAYATNDVIEDILSRPVLRGDGGGVSLEDLRLEFDSIRSTGIATSRSETTVGAGSIAAPVLGGDGKIVAVLSVAGPEARVLDINGERNSEMVLAAAAELTAQFSK